MIPDGLRAEIITACRVLHHFRMVEGFGHVSARVPGTDYVVITPRKALGLTGPNELVELDMEGRTVAGAGRPPLEVAMHLAVYHSRPDVAAICRAHPRFVAAYASAGEPLHVAHGFGCNLGAIVPTHRRPFLVTDPAAGDDLANALGQGEAVILQANGMLAVGQSVPEACVKAMFMEETAQVQLAARAAAMVPLAYTPQTATQRRGMDAHNEPARAWEYYVAVAEGRI